MTAHEDDLSAHAELVGRLRAMGRTPVDADVAARHRALMASVPEAMPAGTVAPRRRLRPVLVGAVAAGTLMGSVGLAGAVTGTSLPEVARATLAKVGLADDESEEATRKAKQVVTGVGVADEAGDLGEDGAGQEAGHQRGTPNEHSVARETCDGAAAGTHGQWVASRPDDPATPDNERAQAARSDCGKPVPSLDRPRDGGAPGSDEGDGSDVRGRPEGRGGPVGGGPGDGGKPPDVGRSPDVGRGAGVEGPHGRQGPPGAVDGHRPAGPGPGRGHPGS